MTNQILLSERACEMIISSAQLAHPNETGGILLGVATAGAPWVVDAPEIVASESGPFHYRLPEGSTKPAVRRAKRIDARLGYIGEWHSHPADVGPSLTDLRTMNWLDQVLRTSRPRPVLVIARRRGDSYRVEAYVTRLLRFQRVDILLTGDLPQLKATSIRPDVVGPPRSM